MKSYPSSFNLIINKIQETFWAKNLKMYQNNLSVAVRLGLKQNLEEDFAEFV